MTSRNKDEEFNLEFVRRDELDSHDQSFESSISEFTEYYKMQSHFDVNEKLVRLYELKQNNKTIGFVTLATAHIRSDATPEIREKEVNGNIPSLLISHLAVHKDFQRKGIGTAFLDFIFFQLVPQIKSISGCRYVLLNPLDDKGVRAFYHQYGFKYYSNLNDDKESDAFLMDLKINSLTIPS